MYMYSICIYIEREIDRERAVYCVYYVCVYIHIYIYAFNKHII